MTSMKLLLTILVAGTLILNATAEPKLGLDVVVEASRAAIRPNEPVVLRTTFTNASSQAFGLPSPILPPSSELWTLTLRDSRSGKTFTGISGISGGSQYLVSKEIHRNLSYSSGNLRCSGYGPVPDVPKPSQSSGTS